MRDLPFSLTILLLSFKRWETDGVVIKGWSVENSINLMRELTDNNLERGVDGGDER